MNQNDEEITLRVSVESGDMEDPVAMGCGYGCVGLMVLSCIMFMVLIGGGL